MATKRMLATIGVLFILFAVSTNASPTVDLTEGAQSMSTPAHCPWNCNLICFGYKRKEDGCLICECDDTVDQFGDIKINNETEKQLKILFNISQSTNVSSNDDVQSAATSTLFRRWNNLPDGNGNWFIPYVIDSSITASDMLNSITQAISDLEENVCFKFRARVESDPSYISFQDLDSGCWSYIGRLTSQPNYIQLQQPGCHTKGIVIHEILHAVGFFHEQSRPDRDDYVLIHPESIIPGKESNFLKRQTSDIDSLGSVYDFSSVMHYSPYSFSIDRRSNMTITKLDGTAYDYQRDGLAASDIFQLRAMYSCESEPATTAEPTTAESTTAEPTTAEPTTAESTTTSDSPTTTAQPCEDKISSRRCRRKKNKGHCVTRSGFMKKNCDKTCGFCGCNDLDDCIERAANDGCYRKRTLKSMQQDCPILCGFCGEGCQDSATRCDRKQSRGLCESKFRRMAKGCRKACGYCVTGNI